MRPKQILIVANAISWIVFIGLCIKAGALMISFFIGAFKNPEAFSNAIMEYDLSQLYAYSTQYYMYVISFILAIAILQAYVFFLVTRIFSKIDMENPFTLEIASLVSKISYYSLVTGIIALIADSYCQWLLKRGAQFDISWGSTEFLFMAGILFIVGFIFTHGVKLQQENDLTI